MADRLIGPDPNAVPSTVQPSYVSLFQSSNTISGRTAGSATLGLSTEPFRKLNPLPRTIRLRRVPGSQRLCRQTAFSSQPASVSSTGSFEVLRTVKCRIVAGRLESSVASGMNGENASSDTETGDAASLYSTVPT